MNLASVSLESSPRLLARAEGVVYLMIIASGIFVEIFVRGRIIAAGDAGRTAENLLAMEGLWRAGIAVELMMVILTVVSTLLLFLLLRPVNQGLALLATFFGIVGISVETSFALKLIETLFPLSGSSYLTAFTAEQLHALTSLTIRGHGHGFGVALFVFAPAFMIRGYLVFRSEFLPAWLGILYIITGVSYLTNSFGLVLAPEMSGMIFMIVVIPAFVGEMSFCLWLLIRGVDAARWHRHWEVGPVTVDGLQMRGR